MQPAVRANRIRSILPVLLLGVVAAACAAVTAGAAFDYRPEASPVPLPAAGILQPATVDEFEGMLVTERGKPVVVNVWASWCGPCRVESPLLARAARSYGDRVAFIGVNSRDDAGDARKFIDRYDLAYPHVFDTTGEIRNRLRLRGFPTTYIFGRDGSLRYLVVGGISEQELAARVDDLLQA
jgi:thiol-disulfide isomerase/thioredoxin